MNALLTTLAEATQELKADYITSCGEFAKKEFAEFIEILDGYEAQWDIKDRKEREDYLCTQVEKYCDFAGFQELKKYYNKVDKAKNIKAKGEVAFIENQKVLAEKHYEASLLKLEDRINKKGLNLENLSFEYAYIERNFNCTISDGNKKVKAQTILAWGDIQKPHYRYLVK